MAIRNSLSIVLATYNGASYLQPQLDSLAGQTCPPDELLVCDDASTDNTMEILARFQRNAPFPVTVHRNPARLGCRENFLQAAALAKGNIIAFCDQDDVWRPNKLQRCLPEFDADAVGMVVHRSAIMDGRGRPTTAVANSVPKTRRYPPGIFVHETHEYNIAGHALLFRREILDLIPTAPRMRAALGLHDGWVAMAGSAIYSVSCVAETLVDYRRHGGSAWGGFGQDRLDRRLRRSWRQGSTDLNTRAVRVQRELEAMDAFAAVADPRLRSTIEVHARLLRAQARTLRARAEITNSARPRGRRVHLWWRRWRSGGYRPFPGGGETRLSVFRDLLQIALR